MSPAKKTRSATARRTSAAERPASPGNANSVPSPPKSSASQNRAADPEVEIHVDEVIDALTRFANNTIHQNVAEQASPFPFASLSTAAPLASPPIDRRRFPPRRVEAAASLASSQPKDPGLLPMPSEAEISRSSPFLRANRRAFREARARAVKSVCSTAPKRMQTAAGIFSSGQSQSVLANSRGLFAHYEQTRPNFPSPC